MKHPQPGLFGRIVDILILVAVIAGLVATHQATEQELERPEVMWNREEYRLLADQTRGLETACFLTEPLTPESPVSELRNANLKLHSCQYAIIPTVLETELTWTGVFERLDAGEFFVWDFRDPDALDSAVAQFRTWAANEKRNITVERVSKNIAVLRARDRQ